MEAKLLNGVRTFAPHSRMELIAYAFENKSILVAVNAEKILHATPVTRAVISRNVGYPDGAGAVWGLEKKGCKHVAKIPGCELWLDIVANYYKAKTFYLVGGKEEVLQQAVRQLGVQFPGMQILNFRNGYLKSEAEKILLLADIHKHKPDVVFVAMGSPKQELLMEEMQQVHPAVYQGLGGSFDVYTGNVKRAPKWWVRNNLEWAYRLLNEPSRIKRQIHLVNFLGLLLFNKI